jgi:hypothetical protein
LIGKEAERRWEHGEDLSFADSKILEYYPSLRKTTDLPSLRRKVRRVGLRESMRRSGLSQHTIEKVLTGKSVRQQTLTRLLTAVNGGTAEGQHNQVRPKAFEKRRSTNGQTNTP